MRVLLDFRDGSSSVDFGDGQAIPLRRPVLAEWCDWQERHDRLVAESFDVLGAALVAGDLAAADEATLAPGSTGELNYDILSTLITRPPVEPITTEHPVWLAICDRQLTVELLTFWRDYPLSPWLNAADRPAAEEGQEERKLVRSTLPGALGARAVLYKALAPALAPRQVDGMELWQIATLLGRDEHDAAAEDAAADAGLVGAPLFDDLDDGGRVVRRGGTETRSWRRKPGAPFLFSAPRLENRTEGLQSGSG